MRLLGLVIGALVILAGATSFAAPNLRLALEGCVTTPAGLYAITALRIAIGRSIEHAWKSTAPARADARETHQRTSDERLPAATAETYSAAGRARRHKYGNMVT
jgi:hypothetical protein